MGRSSTGSVGEPPRIAGAERRTLLELAATSIAGALEGREAPAPPTGADSLTGALGQRRGAFVTLFVDGRLNGCIGTMDLDEPLGASVPRLARAAAFADPRLPALRPDELTRLSIEISVLSPLEPVDGASEADAVAALRPGVDGVLLESGPLHATFLPDVWHEVSGPLEFVRRLELKAGLRPGSWPPGTRISRYTTERFGADATDLLHEHHEEEVMKG